MKKYSTEEAMRIYKESIRPKPIEKVVKPFGKKWLVSGDVSDIKMFQKDVKRLRDLQKKKMKMVSEMVKKEEFIIQNIMKKSGLVEGVPEHAYQRARLWTSLIMEK